MHAFSLNFYPSPSGEDFKIFIHAHKPNVSLPDHACRRAHPSICPPTLRSKWPIPKSFILIWGLRDFMKLWSEKRGGEGKRNAILSLSLQREISHIIWVWNFLLGEDFSSLFFFGNLLLGEFLFVFFLFWFADTDFDLCGVFVLF